MVAPVKPLEVILSLSLPPLLGWRPLQAEVASDAAQDERDLTCADSRSSFGAIARRPHDRTGASGGRPAAAAVELHAPPLQAATARVATAGRDWKGGRSTNVTPK